jgi:RNA 2',3'-cyclic 3'-phosphodiesterase
VTEPIRRPRYPGEGVPGRRLFVAVPIPEDAVREIAAIVERVRAQGVPGGGRDVRWVRLDGLHLTLRFLGPTADERVAGAISAVEAAVVGRERFAVGISGSGTFPPHGRPRALWLGVTEGVEGLASLAAAVDDALRDRGWTLDDRPFRPHLTLARSDGVQAGSAIAASLAEATAGLDLRFEVVRMGLFESLTGGGPARYEPVTLLDLS